MTAAGDDPARWHPENIGIRADMSLPEKFRGAWAYAVSVFGCCTCPPGSDAHSRRIEELEEFAFDVMACIAHLHFGIPNSTSEFVAQH